ncbi:hypothetical protein RQ831_06845 [Roseomonas gilardii]|uniref:Uncharacterized protein n=1 Tax=Roseomonas gilardii TaxID=257708 RepID=A0ABU3MEA8_9PROT|nr:hypothetical protein [Roseomonas gilardii]MDT8330764.1 hypothetical protein [Roseomonas gilardii]
MTIFNIDTIRPGVRKAAFDGKAGWLECFVGEGDHWSFVRPVDATDLRKGPVAEVAEKRRISRLCCSGLYHFGSAALFRDAYAQEHTVVTINELYIAPLYQHLIRAGQKVSYSTVLSDRIFFSGTPAEYENLSVSTVLLEAAFGHLIDVLSLPQIVEMIPVAHRAD